MDLATKKTEFLTPDTADIDDVDLSEDGTKIAFIANEKGVSVVRILDTATRRELPGPRLPIGVAGGVSWHRDGGAIGFTMGTARSNDDAYAWDLETGKLDRWTTSELGGLNPATFAEAELVSWKSFDGREISGFLYRPSAARFPGKRPVVIDIHGGPEGQSAPEFVGRDNYFLNELGVAMIYPNVRGSTGYGKSFTKLDNGTLRVGTHKDIGALLDWIATRPDLDASRVMVQGGSYGGYMTLAVSTHYSSRLKAAVDVVGISNFATFLKNTESYRRDLRRAEYGDERDPTIAAFFEQIAPLNNAAKIAHPLFVVQGGNDPRVPLTEAEQMVARVKQNGKPVWYLMAKDEGHGFAKKSNADFQFYATVMFVRQYLLEEGAGTR
jgi:dipeptidyl aminopeptidase/acylaminoacyl peptidase